MAAARRGLSFWIDIGLIPLINLAAAFLVSGLIVLLIGENPLRAAWLMIYGAFGYGEAWGYTLFYATNFIFVGLAVALAFHAGLFNIGGEGQAYLGGLGIAIVGTFAGFLPRFLAIPAAIFSAALVGGIWGLVPGWLQARRGSHVVVTTILLNFVAASLMAYLLVNVLIRPGQQSPETIVFPHAFWLPQLWTWLGPFGVDLGRSPLNASILLALLCCILFWLLIWKTKLGYEIRVVGHNRDAAVYAGINVGRIVIIAMILSGALAGLMAVNEVLGAQHRVILGFVAGYGYVGIAVALMGRNHPIGIILAAILFGALYQGGSELAFDMPRVSRDIVVVVQGLVILFAGGLEHLFGPLLQARLMRPQRSQP
ncbi:nucleoside ABC transporter membrane protein [Arboricoccus pini]|uniref:Nucleoside ABC transporter membrane protein n=1 Tax=Arboricoccus pini TaxID=1963835 RepID=A0A212QTE1_9PROT|nr:ABC transporter permease [Arboricoccus pini]SNB62885.1 nucleoside ABC transporter membrane protein [Arboricoccus pini]